MKRSVTGLFFLLTLLVALSLSANAQVSGLVFSSSSGTYTPITGGTVHTTSNTWDDTPNYTGVPIGFTFSFDGVNYTTVSISMNGFITFGATAPGTSNYAPLSSSTAYSGAVSGFGRDLQGVSGLGEIRSESAGGVFTVQWSHARRYYSTTSNTEDFSFQIKLYQTSNKIEVVYGSFTDAQSSSSTSVPQVGLRGATNADYNNREVLSTGDWSASTPGASNAATCYYNQATPAVKPASGLTYTWQNLTWVRDIAATSLVSPGTGGCFGTNQTVTIRIKNAGTATLNYAVNPVTVSCSATGPNPQTFSPVTLSSGTLGSGLTQDVQITTTYNMSVGGTYVFNASAVTAPPDSNTSNNAMAPATREVLPSVSIPQTVDFTGFTGDNLTTVFPNWKEQAGVSPSGTSSSWTSQTGLGGVSNITARLNLYTTSRHEWIVGPKFLATATAGLKFKAAVTNWNSITDPDAMGSDDSVQVMVSTDCGITWSSAYAVTQASGLTTTLTEFTVDLSAHAGQYVIVAFYATDGPVDDLNDYDFHIDDISISELTPMVYVSSTTTQKDTSAVSVGGTDKQIIGIEVVTSGSVSALLATQFNLSTAGSTAPSDIAVAKIYYTGGDTAFSTSNLFGSVATPSGAFTISGSRALTEGTNHFWLAYDISGAAVPAHVVDAQCTAMTVGGVGRTPTVTNPAGNRRIRAAMSGVYTIDNTLPTGGVNYATFAAAVADLNELGVSNPVTFNVKAAQTFTDSIEITTTGTVSRPILFKKNGVGANPVITRGGTAATNDAIVTLRGVDHVTFDGIDLSVFSGSTAVEYGYYLVGASTTDGCQYDTVRNCAITLNKANTGSRGVYLASSAAAASGANSFNKFYNNAVTNCYVGYWFNGTTAAYDDGNEVGTSTIDNIGGSSTSTYGVNGAYQTNFKLFNSTISNMSGSSSVYGVYFSLGPNNSVEISRDSIVGLSSSASYVYGIYASSGGTFNIFKNKIHDLAYTGTSSYTVYGMYVLSGATINIYNNFVYDVRAAGSTSSPAAAGLYLSGGTAVNVYYNSVLLSYTSTNASNQSAALYVSTSPTSVDLRNNIFVNTVDVTTGTRATAFRASSSGLANIAATTNNNLYYAGTPGAKRLIFYDGTNADSTLADYKTRIATRDQGAMTENPPFVSAVAPYNLHMQTVPPTQTESGGTPVTSPFAVLDDIDGNVRNVATPDVGADEFTGVVLDLNPPSINYTPLNGTASTTNRTLSTSITDATGVPTSGAGLPRLYWKVNSGSWSGVTATHGSGSQYTFTFGGGVTTGDTVSYYIVARDIAGTPHIGSSPGGASGFTYDPPAASTPPPTPNSYMILTLVSSFPYTEDFEDSPRPESNGAGWTTGIVTGTVNDWIRGTPSKAAITRAHSGLKCYVTKVTGTYSITQNAFIQAPLFNFSAMTQDPVVAFYHNFDTEAGYDACVLEYSTNGGATWRRADSTLGTPPNYNTTLSTAWYNSISTSGSVPPPKWSDASAIYPSADTGWIRSTTVLVGVAGNSEVALRWRFQTDASIVYDGWAVDDVSVYENSGVATTVFAGWNMISNPVTTAADSVKQLFPTSLFPYAFAFAGSGGYVQRYKLENGVGYWGKFSGGGSVTFTGGTRTLDTIDVVTGWNMVGSISSSVDTSTITSIPIGIRRSNDYWYGYDPSPLGYNAKTTLLPGKGYWVKVYAPGQFVFTAGPAPEKAVASGPSILESMNTLTITDGLGQSQTLYFGAAQEALEYEMPPMPPQGVFDARFSAMGGETAQGGAILKSHLAGASLPISIQSAVAPLTVSWVIQNGEYMLDAGHGLKPVEGEGTLTISSPVARLILRSAGVEIPAEYALLQNYPNPFNPSTTIKFGLPVASRVRVEVYNLLGQRVSTLVNNLAMEAGYQSVEWNGTGGDGRQVGSGVYFVRLAADGADGKTFTDVRKMMLIR